MDRRWTRPIHDFSNHSHAVFSPSVFPAMPREPGPDFPIRTPAILCRSASKPTRLWRRECECGRAKWRWAQMFRATLQNLQNAVNGTGTASPGTYGVGTAANTEAQITAVNGGSATVQATAAGSAGNNVQLITHLTRGNLRSEFKRRRQCDV
jgi:hypothetical protein